MEEEAAVIEDRETRISSGGRDTRDDRDSPPRCQGCHERAAQFVCAGCGNQWYCSRECQVCGDIYIFFFSKQILRIIFFFIFYQARTNLFAILFTGRGMGRTLRSVFRLKLKH